MGLPAAAGAGARPDLARERRPPEPDGGRRSGTLPRGRPGAVTSPLAGLPGGAEVGTFVHAVLERVDFTAADLGAEITAAIRAEQGAQWHGRRLARRVVGGLVAALSSPLGSLVDGRTFRDFAPVDRLDELRFELPLAGGDRPEGQVLTADIARLFEASVVPGTPLDGYAARFTSPALATHLRGYLTGSLDLVLRTRDGAGVPRFLVVDYKTNWLGPRDEVLSAWQYRPEALAGVMQRDHYPLQAILYMVALHRYLRWRLPGYDPATHLAGVLYLFLRGMVGPEGPAVDGVPCGVFAWPTPPALVTLAVGSP